MILDLFHRIKIVWVLKIDLLGSLRAHHLHELRRRLGLLVGVRVGYLHQLLGVPRALQLVQRGGVPYAVYELLVTGNTYVKVWTFDTYILAFVLPLQI